MTYYENYSCIVGHKVFLDGKSMSFSIGSYREGNRGLLLTFYDNKVYLDDEEISCIIHDIIWYDPNMEFVMHSSTARAIIYQIRYPQHDPQPFSFIDELFYLP